MKRNILFLQTLQDIKERLIAQDEYKLLGVAGLLRKLLLDKFSLIDQVNQEQKL